MPGTLTIRPLSAKLKRDTEFFGKMDPYCKAILGKQKIQGQVCRNGGKHPHWDDTLVLRRNNESTCQIELKEKDWLLPDGTIGVCDINLDEVEAAKRVLKWYNVSYQTHPIGQILVEASYEPDHSLIQREAPKNIQAPLPQPIIQQENRPVEKIPQPQPQPAQEKLVQEAPAKAGLLSGLIHGWNPFKGSAQPMQEKDVNKEQAKEVQKPAPVEKVPESYPQGGQIFSEPIQQQYKPEDQGHQGSLFAPPISDLQASQEYQQKYPQFESQIYPSTYNYGGYHYNPPTDENQGGMGYQGSQEVNNDYTEVNQQNQYSKNVGGYDPLAVIRGSR